MSSCQLTLVCVKQLSVCASESFPITANVPYDAVLSFGFRACTKKPRNCELSFPESVTARQTVFMSFIVSVIIINTKNCRLSIVLTATDQKPQKSLKRWYYPPSHRLNVNVIGQGMWILWGGGFKLPSPVDKASRHQHRAGATAQPVIMKYKSSLNEATKLFEKAKRDFERKLTKSVK